MKLMNVTPESVGISSEVIYKYINKLQNREVNFHSFLMMKNGKICAEGYCPPYTENKLQRMYSISKTFTSMAVGLMIGEGKINLNDKIVDFFPEYIPQNPHKWLQNMTIEDVLKMSTVFTETKHHWKGGPWVESYLNCPVTHPAGTVFIYDTAGTHTLCAIVEKLSGKPMLEYMRDKLLDPIGFSENAWCIKGTDGYSWGGSGVMATLRDLAKFAYVVMHEGKFDGKQLIPAEYVKKATTCQIVNDEYTDGCLWNEGYGYQIWILKNGVFAFRGMGSQHAICVPEHDLIFCCTCDNQGAEIKDRLIYEEFFNIVLTSLLHTKDENIEENVEAQQKLKSLCENMKILTLKGNKTSSILDYINEKNYKIEENGLDISELSFSFNGDEGVLRYNTSRGKKEILFGFGKHVEFAFPETSYFYEQISIPSGRGYRAWGNAAWRDNHTLLLRVQTLDEYLGNITATFSFKNDEIGIMFTKTAEFFFDEYWGVTGGKQF